MTTLTASPAAYATPDDSAARPLPNKALLALGILLLAFSGMRYNIAPLAWVAPVPWLLYLRRTSGWRSRLLLAGALQVGALFQFVGIITEPIPVFFAPMFSVPAALGVTALYLLFEAGRRRLGDGWGLALLPSLAVVGEWVGANTSEMGSWGAAAYTQIDNLALLQTVSLFGLSGIAWLMALAAAVIAVNIDGSTDGRAGTMGGRWRLAALGTAVLVACAHFYGVVRLSETAEGPMVTVAAVVTDIGLDGGGLPPQAELDAANDALFVRSELAMTRGAQLVAWNEGATAVEAAVEDALIARGQALVDAHGADLVMAYVVPLDGMKRFENKYVWLTPDGVAQTYFKHHPVPGEGSIAGEAPSEVLERPYGRAAGAICYDYDFPAVGRAHAEQDAGLVVVPSSDWRGIDPYHTQMASVRGIEGGYSVLRPVRWATSGAYDAYGRARGTMSWFEDEERVMMARVPSVRVPTLYSRVGDVLPLLSLGVLGLAGLTVLTRLRRR